MALYLTEEDVAAVLTMDIALEEVEKGFVHLAEGTAFNFPRNRLPNGRGSFNFMTATAPDLGVMGMKTYGALLRVPLRHEHDRADRPHRGQRHGTGPHRGR